MKKLFFLLAAVFASFSSLIAGSDWFPILAWGPTDEFPPEGRELVQEDFDLMKECGFTIAGFASEKYLDMIAKAGLKTYLYDPDMVWVAFNVKEPTDFSEFVAKTIEKIKNRPEVIGIYLRDEPEADDLAVLGALSSEIRKQAPELDPYINLYPNGVSDERLGCTYTEYLQKYIEICNMPWLSYDFYSLPNDRNEELSDSYWLNLHQVRTATMAAGIPFYYCTLGVSHFNYRQPTLDDLHFEIYSALLYGAKGIAIFTYFTPVRGNFRNGPINEFGDRTQVWYDLKSVLKSVHNRASLLNDLESKAVYHIPHIKREKGTRSPDENSLLKKVSNDRNARFAVGEFVHKETGDIYIMILNKDLNRSYVIDLEWQGREPVSVEINPASRKGEWHNFAGEEKWIAPGHAHLLRVKF